MRRKNKFYLIWALLLGLAIFGSGLQLLQTYGFSDLNEFAEFLMPSVAIVGFAVVSIVSSKSFYRSRLMNLPRQLFSRKSIGAKRCYNCRKILEDIIGSRCQYCRWIRCSCGACKCGKGQLV